MSSSKPVPTLVVYRLKEGTESEFRSLLARHWPTFNSLGLVSPEPPKIWRATGRDGKVSYVEVFAWKDETSSDTAHQTPEVMQIWEPMGPLLDDLEILEVEQVEF